MGVCPALLKLKRQDQLDLSAAVAVFLQIPAADLSVQRPPLASPAILPPTKPTSQHMPKQPATS